MPVPFTSVAISDVKIRQTGCRRQEASSAARTIRVISNLVIPAVNMYTTCKVMLACKSNRWIRLKMSKVTKALKIKVFLY